MPFAKTGFSDFDYAKFDGENSTCGPRELVECFLRAPRIGDRLENPFSDVTFERLIGYCYLASLLPEEGRLPHFTVVLASSDYGRVPFPHLANFDEPAEIKAANDLRKLAPALSNPALALWLAETDGPQGPRIVCMGTVESHSTHHVRIGRPESQFQRAAHDGTNWVKVSLNAPGHLRITGFGLVYDLQLRGGRIRPITSFLPVLTRAIPGLADEINDRICKAAGEFERNLGRDCTQSLFDTFSMLLSAVVEKRHGGTILMVNEKGQPGAQIRGKYGLAAGHAVELDIGRKFVDLHIESAKVYRSELGEPPGVSSATDRCAASILAARQWHSARENLDSSIRCAAALTCVDGCVVMDRNLNVRLFGAKITDMGGKATVHDTLSESELKPFGTRHNSAYKFCRAHPGSTAVVVSQDGEIRIFFNDGKECQAWEGLEPRHFGLTH